MKSENWNRQMSTCKRYETARIDYVCNLLDDARSAQFEEHLRGCANCRRQVGALQEVMKLIDGAEAEISPVSWQLDDVEMEVYRRLAAENEQASRNSFFLRARRMPPFEYLVKAGRFSLNALFSASPRQVWRGALAGCALAMVLLVSILSFDGDQSETSPVVKIDSLPPIEQLEQYRSQDIRRSLEDVLVIKHLRNDDWETASMVRMLNERAQGTPYESISISGFR